MEAGQAAIGRTYSGELGFLDSEMIWVQNHMVVPKENALHCADCHVPDGRLDFLGLGYPESEAAVLQTLAGFDIEQVGTAPVNTVTEVLLEWVGTPGYSYRVEYSDDMVDWFPAPNGEFSVGAGDPVTDLEWSNAGTGTDAQFYKIVRDRLP